MSRRGFERSAAMFAESSRFVPRVDPIQHRRMKRLGRFTLKERLGMGGMGVVYRAQDPDLGRDVAVKVARRDRGGNILEEARAAATISHPSVATIYSVERASRLSFLVMELVLGESLRDILDRGAMPFVTAFETSAAIAGAVAAAHAHGLIHLDLKPDNVVIRPDGLVKVLDFGLAVSPTRRSRWETWTLATMGTAPYMAPERAAPNRPSAHMDIYSIGALLIECLIGSPAAQDVLGSANVATAAASALEPMVDEVFLPLVLGIIQRCISPEPAGRFSQAGELASSLQAALRMTGER